MRCLPPKKIIISVIAPSWIEIVCMSYEVIIFVRLFDFLNNQKYSCVLYLHNFINESGLPSRNWVHPCFIFINFHKGCLFFPFAAFRCLSQSLDNKRGSHADFLGQCVGL